jgi:predicted nucleotidyltransferase
LHAVVLYGSHARNEATAASDVDVMVVLEGEVDAWEELQRMSEPVYDLELETEEMITLFPISRSEFDNRDSPLLMNVHREGVEV